MSKGDGSTALFTSAAPGKPRGFIEAFSQIERYYELETQGRDIPPGLFTTQQKIEFWEVGFISTFWSSVFSIALAPLAIGVIEKYIPVLGVRCPLPPTRSKYSCWLSALPSDTPPFLGQLGRYYDGKYTKRMIRSFMSGIVMTAILKILIAVVLFHFLALYVCEPPRVERMLLYFKGWICVPTLISIYNFIVDFRGVFLTSAWFVTATPLFYIAVPAVSIWTRVFIDKRYRRKGGKKL